MDLRVKIIIQSGLVLLISLVSVYTAGSILYNRGIDEINTSLSIAGASLTDSIKAIRSKDKLIADDIALEPRVFDLVKTYVSQSQKKRAKILARTHLALIDILSELYPESENSKLRVEILTQDALVLADQKASQVSGVPKQEFAFPEKNPEDVIFGVWGADKVYSYTASRVGNSKNTYGWIMVSRVIDTDFLADLSKKVRTSVIVMQGKKILGATLEKDLIIDNFDNLIGSQGKFYIGGPAGGIGGMIFGLREYRSVKVIDEADKTLNYILNISTGSLGNSLSLIVLMTLIFSFLLVGLTAGFGFWIIGSIRNALRYPLLLLKRGLEGGFEPEAPPENLPMPFQDIASDSYRVVMQVRSQKTASPIIGSSKRGNSRQINNILNEVPSAPPSLEENATANTSLPFINTSSEGTPQNPELDAESDPLGIFSGGGAKPEEDAEDEFFANDAHEVTAPRIPPGANTYNPETTRPAATIRDPLEEAFPETEDENDEESGDNANPDDFAFGTMGDDVEELPYASSDDVEDDEIRYDQESTMIASADQIENMMTEGSDDNLEEEEEEEEEDEEEETRFDEEKTMIASSSDLDAMMGDPGSHQEEDDETEEEDDDDLMPFDEFDDDDDDDGDEAEQKAKPADSSVEINPEEYSDEDLDELLGSFSDDNIPGLEEEPNEPASAELEENPEEENATMVLQVPDGFWDKSKSEGEVSEGEVSEEEVSEEEVSEEEKREREFKEHAEEVFNNFKNLKVALGGDAENMVFDKFYEKLKSNRLALMEKHQCSDVRFEAYEREGKAALKATPIKD